MYLLELLPRLHLFPNILPQPSKQSAHHHFDTVNCNVTNKSNKHICFIYEIINQQLIFCIMLCVLILSSQRSSQTHLSSPVSMVVNFKLKFKFKFKLKFKFKFKFLGIYSKFCPNLNSSLSLNSNFSEFNPNLNLGRGP
jgi:hypothetical protein